MIELECICAVTLTRGDDRVSLKHGARLKLGADGDGFNPRHLQRAIAGNKLRVMAGHALLARLQADADPWA